MPAVSREMIGASTWSKFSKPESRSAKCRRCDTPSSQVRGRTLFVAIAVFVGASDSVNALGAPRGVGQRNAPDAYPTALTIVNVTEVPGAKHLFVQESLPWAPTAGTAQIQLPSMGDHVMD
jgi:hypothetical protein